MLTGFPDGGLMIPLTTRQFSVAKGHWPYPLRKTQFSGIVCGLAGDGVRISWGVTNVLSLGSPDASGNAQDASTDLSYLRRREEALLCASYPLGCSPSGCLSLWHCVSKN
jgi:hypothetical protein